MVFVILVILETEDDDDGDDGDDEHLILKERVEVLVVSRTLLYFGNKRLLHEFSGIRVVGI